MSFTIKCDKCGNEQKLIDDNVCFQEKISIEYERFGEPYDILVECKQCKNLVDNNP